MKEISISPLLSEGMVMQRDASFPIWSRERLTVTFLGETFKAHSVEGKWLIILEPLQAGGPYTMDISCEGASVTIRDIYSGDVWLCAGQSNMELQMERLRDDYGEEWEGDFPLIRQFKVPQEWDFSGPRDELSGGRWLVSSKETLSEFSATAWFFARNMYEKHRIPIGLINTAWGGTPIESWMSKEALAGFTGKIAEAEYYADNVRCVKIAKETGAAIQEWETCLKNKDAGLNENWKDEQTDISAWETISLPCDFAEAGLADFCGVIWLAKDFEVDADFASRNAKVWLGTIVDADAVYINGVEIGNTTYRYPPRKYSVPSGILKEGKNRIIIRVTSNNGEGGVTRGKPFRIFTDNESVQLVGSWKYKIAATNHVRPKEFFFQWQPTGDYNAMIAPVLKYWLKGVIWYQGESNAENPYDYAKLFRSMIQDWRGKSVNIYLPFLFVQLPVFESPGENNEQASWAIIREAQAAALFLPYTGMATALELGEWNDMHPLNKKDVGYRLFLAADKLIFKNENTSPGPLLRSFEKRQDKLYLYFDNCGSGLTVNGDEKPYVSLIDGSEQIRLPAEIEEKDVVSIDISSGKNPQKVLYAWAFNPHDRQLFNSEGLPAIPFRIDIL